MEWSLPNRIIIAFMFMLGGVVLLSGRIVPFTSNLGIFGVLINLIYAVMILLYSVRIVSPEFGRRG